MSSTKQIQNVTMSQADWGMKRLEQAIKKDDIELIRFAIRYLISWCKDTKKDFKRGIWN